MLVHKGRVELVLRSKRLRCVKMTLWSMAKSPLMFGGDMRNLDDATFNLMTNPYLMEINSYSSNNREFPYVSGTKDLRLRKRGLNFQSRSLKDASEIKKLLGLTSCKDAEAEGWYTKNIDEDLEQICWKGSSRSKVEQPFCLYKRENLMATDEEMLYKKQYQGKLHLLPSLSFEFCFDASPTKRLTAGARNGGSFSPCRRHTGQMWELNENGTLVNSYSGLCASMNAVKDNDVPGGIRSWIATGKRGLNPPKLLLSYT